MDMEVGAAGVCVRLETVRILFSTLGFSLTYHGMLWCVSCLLTEAAKKLGCGMGTLTAPPAQVGAAVRPHKRSQGPGELRTHGEDLGCRLWFFW